MSFWDNVKKFTQPYSDDEYEDYEDEVDQFEEEEEPRRTSRGGRRANPFADAEQEPSPAASASSASSSFGGQSFGMGSGKQEVVLFHAKTFDDTAKAADELRKKRAVILNMENVDKALTRRVVDFLSGSVYALDGRVKKVAQSTYLFCPHNMEVVGDLEGLHSESESYM